MNTAPVAASATLAESATADPRRTRARTQRSEVHQAWEDNDPIIHRVNDTATIELRGRPGLYIQVIDFERLLTRRPSVSQEFKKNMLLGTTLIAFELMRSRYP